jgi:hypothetical protein
MMESALSFDTNSRTLQDCVAESELVRAAEAGLSGNRKSVYNTGPAATPVANISRQNKYSTLAFRQQQPYFMIRPRAQDIIVPLRFLSIATFLVLCAMVTYTVKNNILATYPYDLDANWNGAVGSVVTAVCIMALCLIIQLIGFVGGCTFFN